MSPESETASSKKQRSETPKEDAKCSAVELFYRYGCCMAFLETEGNGDLQIGGAFHIGDGVFVTARHVVEGRTVKQIRLSDPDLFHYSDLYPRNRDGWIEVGPESKRMTRHHDGTLTIVKGPVFHPNERVDVAAFVVEGMQPNAHYVPLGLHLDDWVGRYDFQLSRCLVFGYPPVPLTTGPHLVVARAEVNAVVDLRLLGPNQLHFLLSATPRGGFSGGLAFSRLGYSLGVVTRSLAHDHKAAELGFFAVTSIEAILECLGANRLMPPVQDRILAPLLELETLNDPPA